MNRSRNRTRIKIIFSSRSMSRTRSKIIISIRSRRRITHLLSDLRNMSSSACILQQRACLLWSEGQEVATRWWPRSREVAESTWRGVVREGWL